MRGTGKGKRIVTMLFVVYEEGTAFIRGNKSLDEAMNSIETRLGIYLAE